MLFFFFVALPCCVSPPTSFVCPLWASCRMSFCFDLCPEVSSGHVAVGSHTHPLDHPSLNASKPVPSHLSTRRVSQLFLAASLVQSKDFGLFHEFSNQRARRENERFCRSSDNRTVGGPLFSLNCSSKTICLTGSQASQNKT